MKAFLDTNVIISGLILPSGVCRDILDSVRDGLTTWILSDYVLDEVRDVLNRPKIRQKYGVESKALDVLLELLAESILQIPGTLKVEGMVADPKDDPILAGALEGEAAYLVTGDASLLELDPLASLRIVTPREYLDLVHGS